MLSSSNAPLRAVYALLASIVAGLLLAAVAFPLVGGLSLTAKAGADEFLVLPAELETAPLAQRTRILAADGSQIAVLYRQNRVSAKIADVPEQTRQAVIATEDARFYSHNGVDVKGTLRAAVSSSAGRTRNSSAPAFAVRLRPPTSGKATAASSRPATRLARTA